MAVAEPIGVRSQSEEAYARILERIVSLEMPPGSVVNEARLREELKIGRTPIREALQRLTRENLVKSIPHRGTGRHRIPRRAAGGREVERRRSRGACGAGRAAHAWLCHRPARPHAARP